MIERIAMTCVLCAIGSFAVAQFDYFEIVDGYTGDTISNGSVSIQLSESGFVSWGLYSTIGYNHVYLYEYDFSGVRIDSNAFTHPEEFVYIGSSQSFKRNSDLEGYYYSAGIVQADNTTAGYLMSFSNDLDTNFTKRYEPYQFTYIRGVEIFEDEYILLGDYSPNDGFVGTFLLRTNLTGEILSNTLLHEYENGANYSNSYIEKVGEKYFIAGLIMDNGDQYGLLSITDLGGNLIEEIEYYDQSYGDWSRLGIAKLINGELMTVQSLGYEEYVNGTGLDFHWMNVRLSKIDAETGEEYWSQSYLENNELIYGRWVDIEPTDDGGAVILGIAYSPEITIYNYLLKIDAAGNQEWLKEYWVEESAINWLRDIEVAHDGGYIMAGTLQNSTIDNYSRAWILKVDACGDTEWQDCQPLSTSKEERQSLKVFPNPSSGQFTVEVPANLSPVSWELLDISGRKMKAGNLDSISQEFSVDVKLPSGIYMLLVSMKSGIIANHKVYVE